MVSSTFAIKIKKTATIFVDLLRDFYQWMRTFSADPNPPTPRPPTPSAEVLAAIEFLVRQYPSLAESPVVAVNRSFYAPDTRRDVQRSVLQMMQVRTPINKRDVDLADRFTLTRASTDLYALPVKMGA